MNIAYSLRAILKVTGFALLYSVKNLCLSSEYGTLIFLSELLIMQQVAFKKRVKAGVTGQIKKSTEKPTIAQVHPLSLSEIMKLKVALAT